MGYLKNNNTIIHNVSLVGDFSIDTTSNAAMLKSFGGVIGLI